MKLAFINESDRDRSISFYDFECYADGYAAEMHYRGEEDLSATLSAGRAAEGYLYYEIPENAQDIDIEYETNFITEEKIHFVRDNREEEAVRQDCFLFSIPYSL